jgi:hypothetical protein
LGRFNRALNESDFSMIATPTTSAIAEQIQRLLPKVHNGSLRFWGVWFGKPYDNNHTIVKSEANGDCLILHFDGEETLQVWNPQACLIDSRQFVIELASRVLWQWYWYGRPHTPANLMSDEYVKRNTEITFTSTFPAKLDAKPSFNEPAVQIH